MLRRHCLDAHAKAGMVLDTGRLVEMLAEVLEPVLHGELVEVLSRPWPPVSSTAHAAGGLWWEK